MRGFVAVALIFFGSILTLVAADAPQTPDAARGKKSLEKTAFIPAFWPRSSYDNAWKRWGISTKPANYDAAFRERYGLHAATFENDGLPMGLRLSPYLPFTQGIGIDCMVCHSGSIGGKSYLGLGNTSLDIHTLFEDMAAAGKMPVGLPFQFTQTRGTNEAGAFSVYLLGYRDSNLNPTVQHRDLGLHDDSCEDVPAWWLLKRKKTMYHVGATDSNSARSIMQFMMHPLTLARDFDKAEPAFRDILQYIRSLEAPKYPYPIDTPLAARGQEIFATECASCHGTYGPEGKYPNRIIPLEKIGTDRTRFDNIGTTFTEAYNDSWFAKEAPHGKPIRPTVGYQAPPLDGVWATAPYFHNGSVPTLDAVLNSTTRPTRFTRSFQTDEADFDKVRVGWKTTEVPADKLPTMPFELRKIYDTTLRGRGNGGHTFGDALTPQERAALLEYLKTL